MKINKIFIGGLAILSLTACNDYLDVEPATNVADLESVYSAESEIDKALNGVYAKIQTDATFGSDLYVTFQLNSDVDFASNANETAQGNQPRRFDLRADASNVEKLWNNLYSGVEAANEFIYNLQNSPLYVEGTTTEAVETANGLENKEVPEVTNLTQMMGEAKVMRAMFYHELLSYWGDIPFTMQATFETENLLPPMTKRQEVSDALIADLRHAAEYMKSDKVTTTGAPERISQEAAYAMIARLALQAGGYSLNHDANDATNYQMTRPSNYQEYYIIARDYTKRIIDAGGHRLSKSFRDVFIDECNFVASTGDDPIFEIPFAKETNGNWGYAQGPTNGVDTGVETDYTNSAWGATSGGVRTTAFYGYSFDSLDVRRDYICGLWYYSNQGLPTMRLDYAMHNNKWSKLWNSNGLGKTTTGATGINFAYIRYADVLLMFAEAENELSGPTAAAQEALKTVRRRAFDSEAQAEKVDQYVAAATSKADFLKLVLDERKWEFAGENMRWKDLVRNNMYAEKVFFTFLDYYAVTEAMAGTSSYIDMVEEYDKVPYSEVFVQSMYSILVRNYVDPNFPNRGVYMFYVANPYNGAMQNPTGTAPAKYFEDNEMDFEAVSPKTITGLSTASNTVAWTTTTLAWSNDDGTPKNQVVYSLYGYIRINQAGNIVVVNNGSAQPFSINPNDAQANISRLPAVRYLLPIPDEAIARSGGVYKNYYGY